MPQLHERKIKPRERKALADRGLAEVTDRPSADCADCTWDRFPGIANDLPDLAAAYLANNEELNRLKAIQDTIRERIGGILTEAAEPVIHGDFFKVEAVTSHKPSRLDRFMLLEAGVKAATIEACTVGGEEYTYVKVSVKG